MKTARARRNLCSRRLIRWVMLAPIVLASGPVILGAGKDKRKNAPPAYTLVAGTVFRDTGLALPGAEVVLTSTGDAEGARKYKNRAVTDSRGEFALRARRAQAATCCR